MNSLQKSIINNNFDILASDMRGMEMFGKLVSKGLITDEQMDKFIEISSTLEQNTYLLLELKKINSFSILHEILIQTQQQHLAKILAPGVDDTWLNISRK